MVLCYLGGSMKLTKTGRGSFPPFETGQVWELTDSQLHIVSVGKLLVHYKHFQGNAKRAPVSLANKVALEKSLIKQKAVLSTTPKAA